MHFRILLFTRVVRLLIRSSSRLHDEDLRFELDSTEVVPTFELDDTSVDITPSLHSQNEVATDPHEPSTDSVPEGHPVFETPDDVGADLSTSPSVKARNIMGNVGGSQSEDTGTSSRRNIPPELPLSHSNHTQLLRVEANYGHESSANHQKPPSYTSSPNSTDRGSQVHQSPYMVNQEKPGTDGAGDKDEATDTKRSIEQITERRKRTAARERYPGRFRPSMLPNLEVLTLTDVPSTTRRQNLVDSITMFIQECAEEEELAALEDLEFQERNNPYSGKHSSNGIFRLQCLVLEMSTAPDPIEPPHSAREHRHSFSFTKSSTEDPDSEMFMEASENDFSFFREDDGGLLVTEGKIDTPTTVDGGMIYMGSPTSNGHPVDVIPEVANFRREKKMAYEAAVRMGRPKLDTALLGHWKGKIKVVKH